MNTHRCITERRFSLLHGEARLMFQNPSGGLGSLFEGIAGAARDALKGSEKKAPEKKGFKLQEWNREVDLAKSQETAANAVRRSQALEEKNLPADARNAIRQKAVLFASQHAAITEWEDYKQMLAAGRGAELRFLNNDQYTALERINADLRDAGEEEIVLGIEGEGKNRHLTIFNAPPQALNRLQNMLADLWDSKGRGGASGWPDELCARPGTERRGDQKDAITRFREQALSVKKDFDEQRKGLSGAALDALLDAIKAKPCPLGVERGDTSVPWGQLYPSVYRGILRDAIIQDRTLVRRAESGAKDGDAFSEPEFESFLTKSVIGGHGATDVLSHLSPEWIKSHPDHFLRIATEAVKKDPEAVKLINFDLLPEDAYEKILKGTIEIDYAAPAPLPAAPAAVPALSPLPAVSEPVAASSGAPDASSTTTAAPTAAAPASAPPAKPSAAPSGTPAAGPVPILRPDGLTPEKVAAMDRTLFTIPSAVVQRRSVDGTYRNRTAYFDRFSAVAALPVSKTLGNLTRANRSILDGYHDQRNAAAEKPFEKLGWAYMIRDVAKRNPENLMHLSDTMVADIKALPQPIFDAIQAASFGHLPSAIRLGGTEIIGKILKNPLHTTTLAQGLVNHPEHIALIPQPIIEKNGKETIMKMITGNIPGCDYENIALLQEEPLRAWRSDPDTVLKLVSANKSVLRVVDPALKTLTNDETRNQPILQLLYAALRQAKGSLNWDTDVPSATWEHIAARIGDADPGYKEFLPYMLDPENYENLPDVAKLFSIIDGIPKENQTAKTLLGNAAIMRSINTYPQFYSRIANVETRGDIKFITEVTIMNPDIIRYVKPTDIKPADFEQFLRCVHGGLWKKGEIAKDINLRAHFDQQGRTVAEYWPFIAACTKDTAVLKHLPREEIKKIRIEDLRQFLDAKIPAGTRDQLWDRIEPRDLLALYLQTNEKEQKQILEELGEARTRAMFQSGVFAPEEPAEERASEAPPPLKPVPPLPNPSTEPSRPPKAAAQSSTSSTTPTSSPAASSTTSADASGNAPRVAAPAAPSAPREALPLDQESVVRAALAYRELLEGPVLDGQITPDFLRSLWQKADALEKDGKATEHTPMPGYLRIYFGEKIRALGKEKERIAKIPDPTKLSAREQAIKKNVDISDLIKTYQDLVREYSIRTPDTARGVILADEKFIRNDAQQIKKMIDQLYREVKGEKTRPMPEAEYSQIEERILAAATDEALTGLMKTGDENDGYWYLTRIDKIGRLQGILAAEDAKNDQTLFVRFVSKAGARCMLPATTREHLLKDKDFIVKMFHGAGKEEEPFVLERAADIVLYAIVSEENPDEAMLKVMDTARIRGLVTQAGSPENGNYFVNVIRLTQDPTLLKFANQDSVANDAGMIDRLLKDKDPAKNEDKDYIRTLLTSIHLDQVRRLLDPAKNGEERASAYEALAPWYRDQDETITARTEEINKMKDGDAKKKAISDQQDDFIRNLEKCAPVKIGTRASDFVHLHEEAKKSGTFVLRALESIQGRVATEVEHKAPILSILRSAGAAAAVEAFAKLGVSKPTHKQILDSVRYQPEFTQLLRSPEGRANTAFYLNALRLEGKRVLENLSTGDPVTKDRPFADAAEKILLNNETADSRIVPLFKILDITILAENVVNNIDLYLPHVPNHRYRELYDRVQRTAPEKATALARELIKRDPSLQEILPSQATVTVEELRKVLTDATKTSQEQAAVLRETDGVLPVLAELLASDGKTPPTKEQVTKVVLSDPFLMMRFLGYIASTPRDNNAKQSLITLFEHVRTNPGREELTIALTAGIPREYCESKAFFDSINFPTLEREVQIPLMIRMSPSCLYAFVKIELAKPERDTEFLRFAIGGRRGSQMLSEVEAAKSDEKLILYYVRFSGQPVLGSVDRGLRRDAEFLIRYLDTAWGAPAAERVVQDILDYADFTSIEEEKLVKLFAQLLQKTSVSEANIVSSIDNKATFLKVLKVVPFAYYFGTDAQKQYAIEKEPLSLVRIKEYAALEQKLSIPKTDIDTMVERYYLLSAFPKTYPAWQKHLQGKLEAIHTLLAVRSAANMKQVQEITEKTIEEMKGCPTLAHIRETVQKDKDPASHVPAMDIKRIRVETVTPPGHPESQRLSYVSPRPDVLQYRALHMQWILEKGDAMSEKEISYFTENIDAMLQHLDGQDDAEQKLGPRDMEKNRTEALKFLSSFKSALNRNPAAEQILIDKAEEGSLMEEALAFMNDPIFLQALDANRIEHPEAPASAVTVIMQPGRVPCRRFPRLGRIISNIRSNILERRLERRAR